MREKILLLLISLGLCFTALNATEDCSEIEVMAVQETLQSYSASESETVEVVIHNPDYCLSTITDITLSDSENFELDLDFGAVPCGSDNFSMRGYQFCTVGVTFKPVTSSGDFETDVVVSTTSTPVTSASIEGEVVVCDECNNDDDDDDSDHDGCGCDDDDSSCGHGGHGHHGGHGKGCGKGHGGHDKGCGKGHGGHSGHGKGCGKGHGSHGNTCSTEDGHDGNGSCSHRHNRWCGYDRGHGTCGHKHSRRCGGVDNGHSGHGNTCGKGHGKRHGGHGMSCGSKGHGGHDKGCGKGHGGHGNTCSTGHGHDGNGSCGHRHNRWCGYDRGHGTCGHKHNRWCGYEEDDNDNGHSCPPLDPVKKLVDSDATNYINCLNLTNPVGTSVVEVYDDIVYFNDYNEKEVGLATFELDDVVDFSSMLTFTATIDEGLFMPRMSGDDGQYMTTDVRVTKQYGFIFPDDFDLTELNFTTWGRSFTGSIEDLSVTEVTNENLLD